MTVFNGFPVGKVPLTPIPDPFFKEILPAIDDLDELKVTLFIFWFLAQQEGDLRYLSQETIVQDKVFMAGLGDDALKRLSHGLAKAASRGTIIQVQDKTEGQMFYFLNSPRGRAAAKLAADGRWQPGQPVDVSLQDERPNIFRLYEEHIGPLTPIMSDTLKDAEKTYPPDWIDEAVTIAVRKNVRNWHYIDTILRSWKEKGRHEPDRRNAQEDTRKYIQGEYADFIEH